MVYMLSALSIGASKLIPLLIALDCVDYINHAEWVDNVDNAIDKVVHQRFGK